MSAHEPLAEHDPDALRHLSASPPALAPWVEVIWYSEGRLHQLRERVLPAATADIVANLGAPMRLVEGVGDPIIRGTTLSGLLTRPLLLEHPPLHRALGMRLSPLGLRAILGIPGRVALDACFHLTDVLDLAVDDLAERCAGAPSPQAALDAAIAWVARRVRRHGGEVDPLVRWAVGRIEAARGNLSIAGLQQASGYGATRFQDRFTDELGVTPKRFARLARLRAALEALDAGARLADLAIDAGFTDQPHLNREFRALLGMTPREVLATRYPSGLTLAEPLG